MFGQQQHVAQALTQRRQPQWHDLQAVPQVFPEAPLLDRAGQVSVRGHDDAHVHGLDAVGADGRDLAFLQHPQDLCLRGQRHVAYLVEEQGAAIGLAKAPGAFIDGTGERAFNMTEQLAFHQFGRDCGAVHCDEGAGGSSAVAVQGARHQFLACTRLAEDQGGGIGVCGQPDALEDLAHGLAATDQFGAVHGRSCGRRCPGRLRFV
ncbi:hypothetical protein D3C81_720520 [compost metagenome]